MLYIIQVMHSRLIYELLILSSGNYMRIYNSNFANHYANDLGGVIYSTLGGHLYVLNSTSNQSSASNYGGFLWVI